MKVNPVIRILLLIIVINSGSQESRVDLGGSLSHQRELAGGDEIPRLHADEVEAGGDWPAAVATAVPVCGIRTRFTHLIDQSPHPATQHIIDGQAHPRRPGQVKAQSSPRLEWIRVNRVQGGPRSPCCQRSDRSPYGVRVLTEPAKYVEEKTRAAVEDTESDISRILPAGGPRRRIAGHGGRIYDGVQAVGEIDHFADLRSMSDRVVDPGHAVKGCDLIFVIEICPGATPLGKIRRVHRDLVHA